MLKQPSENEWVGHDEAVPTHHPGNDSTNRLNISPTTGTYPSTIQMETPNMLTNPILHTIGHSNHPIETFLYLLEKHQIQQVIDVRSTPYSRYTPWFDETELPNALSKNQVA